MKRSEKQGRCPNRLLSSPSPTWTFMCCFISFTVHYVLTFNEALSLFNCSYLYSMCMYGLHMFLILTYCDCVHTLATQFYPFLHFFLTHQYLFSLSLKNFLKHFLQDRSGVDLLCKLLFVWECPYLICIFKDSFTGQYSWLLFFLSQYWENLIPLSLGLYRYTEKNRDANVLFDLLLLLCSLWNRVFNVLLKIFYGRLG